MKQFLTLLMLHLIRINRLLFNNRKIAFTVFCLAWVLGGLNPTFAQFDLSGGVSFTGGGGNPLNVAIQDTAPEAMCFSPDGTRMFFIGSGSDMVHQYNLSTAFDITTAVLNNNFSVAGQIGLPRGVAFSTTGTKMYVSSNTDVFQYTLSTAFQVNTATYDGVFYVTASTAGRGVTFSPTGDRMFVTDTGGGNNVLQYNLSTPFNLSSGVSSGGLFSVGLQDGSPQGTHFSPDGTRMFFVGDNNKRVYQYTLSTAFEVSTATYSSSSVLISSQQNIPTDVAFSADGLRMYILGEDVANKSVHQYNLVIYYSRQSGNWNDTNTWSSSCGGAAGIGVPPTTANVITCNGHTVTLTANATCNNLTINSGGILKPAGFNLTANGATTVNGTFLNEVVGGTNTFNALTVGASGSFEATSASSTFVFQGNISNASPNFNLAGNVTYTFNNTLTIGGTEEINFGQSTTAGTGTINPGFTVTVLETTTASPAKINFNGTNNFTINGTLINQNRDIFSGTVMEGRMVGTGTFTNSADATFLYEGNGTITVTNFNVSASGNLFRYNGGTQTIRVANYHHLATANGGTKTLAGNTTINGDLAITASSTLNVNTFDLTIGGGMYAGGGGVFTPQLRTVTFSGSGNNNFTGNDPITFYNMVVNKTANTDIVYLSGDFTVTNVLTLTNGLVYAGNHTLTYGGAAGNLTRTNGWINTNGTGTLIRSASGTNLLFPVGTATQYQPLVLGTSSANASVRFGSPTATVPTSGIGSWFVNNASATSTVRFNNPQGGSIINGISAVGKYGSSWVAMTGTTYPTATDYSVSNIFTGSVVEFGILTTNSFRTTWVTTTNSITIPTTAGVYNYNVAWRNLTSPGVGEGNLTGQTGDANITGLSNGHTYRIDIAGTFPHIFFNNSGDKTKIKTIEQWGNIAWTSMQDAFWGCNTLTYNATDTPNFSTGSFLCSRMFMDCSIFNGNSTMNSWNTANVVNMQRMFANAGVFNQDISGWNTALVTDMQYMFNGATSFNQNIGSWNTGAVTNMTYMFSGASAFNQNIGTWNTTNVTNMNNMFAYSGFNQNIGSWNTSNVTDMGGMFVGNTVFNQNLSAWNVGKVNNFFGMFQSATSFNTLPAWTTIGTTATNISMLSMFSGASAFNQSLASWDMTDVTNLTSMLDNCGMSTANYDATLVGWAAQGSLPTSRTLGAAGLSYCTSSAARNTLTATKSWTISGDSNACPTFSAIAATNVTTTSFTANWTSDITATSYDIEVSTTGSFTGTPTQTGITSTNSVRTAVANTIYYYRVRRGTPTTGGWSNTKMVSTILPAGSGNLIGVDGTAGKKVHLLDNTIFNFTNTNNFTLSAWIKINALGTDMHIISKRNTTQGYALWVNAAGRLSVFRDATANNGTTTLPTNTWVHIAVVFSSGGGFTTYINGALEATVGVASITGTTERFTIGSRADNTFPFNGQIDEVRIWNTARNITQIQASMCAKLVGNETGLVGYFRLDENTGSITENKAYVASVDGTLVGSPTWNVSGAPLGDVSANTYGGASITLTNTDVMTANGFLGSPAGVHLYKVNASPNATGVPSGYNSMRTDRYWGLFFVGGSSPTADLTYNYSTNGNISNENAFRFGKRANNADGTWVKNGGVVYDTGNLLSQVKETSGEFILCEKNTTIPQVRNGGMVLNLNGSNGVTVPNPVSTNFTIEFWMRSSQASTGATHWYNGARLISSTLASNGTQNDYGISVLGGKLAFGIGNTTIVSTTSVNTGAWFHVAVKRQISGGNSILTIVLNGGKEIVTSSASTNISGLTASTNLTIGNRNNTDFYFTGEFDELRFWDTVLTNFNISNWMNLRANQNHSNIQNLVAYYRFDENIGNTTENLITSADAAMTNSAMWVNSTQPLADGNFHRLTVNTASQVAVFTNAGVTVNFGAIVPNGEVVATQLDAVPNNFPAVVGMSFLNSYWVIRNYGTNQTFSFLPEIKFEVPSGNVISPTDLANPNNIKLYKRPDNAVAVGDWIGVARATGFGSIRFAEGFAGGSPTPVSDFSQFVIGSITSPLPITLTGLQGRREEGVRGETTENVRLEWQTAQEINNKGFEVEMSIDGLAYQKIAFVDGKGTSNTPINYQLNIINPNEAYYRLKQIDFDGKFSYSPVVFVEGMVGKDFVRVYPNPTQHEFRLKVSENILPTEAVSIEIYDMVGKCVWRGAGKLAEVEANINLTFTNWKAGTYILHLRTDKKKVQTKFVKE